MEQPLNVWRHPRPRLAAGRCIGRTDLLVDRRKTKRLAHRIRKVLRRSGRPCGVVVTSPLARCADVGRWLARWGCTHRVDARLLELNFGRWDGATWASIGEREVTAWTDDFAHRPPGDGESVAALLQRCAGFLADAEHRPVDAVVAHAGWLSAALWLAENGAAEPTAARWPPAIGYGRRLTLARLLR